MKSIKEIINENNKFSKSHYDVLGENMKIPEDVIFYYEDGIKDKMDNNTTKTPRLYRGILQEWDNKKLIGTIKTLDFDQDNYNIPKIVKVHQLLILKHKWR